MPALWPLPGLLYEAELRLRGGFSALTDGAELRFVAIDILAQRAPQALDVARTQNVARNQLSLGDVGEDVDKVQGELLGVVVDHHQVAVLAEQLFLIGLDLDLRLLLGCLPQSRRAGAFVRIRLPPHGGWRTQDGVRLSFRNEKKGVDLVSH